MSHQITEYDLMQLISGCDEQGAGKCIITIQPQRCDAEGNVVNTDIEYTTEKPVVQLFKQAGGYVLVDFLFESVNDIDLQRLYSYFQDFFTSTNSTSDDELEFPLLAVSIVPKVLKGKYWAMGLNPVFYALAPDDINGEPKILRLMFVSQDDPDILPNFLFLKSDENELEKIINEDETAYEDAE